MTHTYDIYGLGAALVDTEVKVSDDDLKNLGVEKGLMTLVDRERQLALLEELKTHLVKAQHASGGSAANSVYATARFGGKAFFSCKVAQDADGDLYLADMEKAGVHHNYGQQRDSGVTGKCLVMITPDAERSMNSFLGISSELSVSELAPDALATSKYLYLEGYVVSSPSACAAAIEAKQQAEAAGVKTVLSFSDPGMVEFFRDNMQAIVGDGLDLVFCNEVEAKQWAQTDDLNLAAERLKEHARQFAITRSSEGAILWDGKELIDIPPHRVQAVDTNGAGDMFAGAFIYALSRGENFPTAGRFASLAAGTIVANYGPRLKPEGYAALRQEFFGS